MANQRLLLCTDMDRTVIPNGTQSEHKEARNRFSEFCALPWVTLVYVTGRHFDLAREAISFYALPDPNYIVSDVGTKIYEMDGHEGQELLSWQQEIDKAWAGHTHADLKKMFLDIKALRIQELSKQNVHKLSYYVTLHTDHQALMAELERRLMEAGVGASLIWSIDEPKGIGLLDVLPKNATKLHAVEFLYQGLDYKLSEVVFAGDSGNDLPVMASVIQSVLVANAADDVQESAKQIAEMNGCLDALYLASGANGEMNGNYSAGVLEGVGHFIPESHSYLNRLGFNYG